MSEQVEKFDVAIYLDSDDVIAEYLTAALEDPDPGLFVVALGHVARARGMTKIAHSAALGRESLYKALAPGAHPRYETIRSVIEALGLKMNISA